MPTLLVPLYEFNHCHNPSGPAGGQFCAAADSSRVGITSQRPVGDTGRKTDRQVFKDMRALEAGLKALPDVANVSVKPGLGAWQDSETGKVGSEATWQVSYRGNGAARKLLAETGRRYNQDAVLIMHGCKGPNCDPAVELAFDRPVGRLMMDAIGQRLGAAGLGGWTWGKRGGKTILRAVSVLAWGGERQDHLTKMQQVSTFLRGEGLTHRFRVKPIRAEALNKDAYASVIGGPS